MKAFNEKVVIQGGGSGSITGQTLGVTAEPTETIIKPLIPTPTM